VVDQATLSEFAASLRVMLTQARDQREHLRRSVSEGESVAASLRDTTAQATEKLRPALKLLPAIDAKLKQAQQAMDHAKEAARSAGQAAAQAAKSANEESIVALRDAHHALEASTRRARDLEARLGMLTERAQAALDAFERDSKDQLEKAAAHARDVLGTTVAEIDTRAEQALDRITSLIEERALAAECALESPIEIGSNGLADSQRPAESETTPATDQSQASHAIDQAALTGHTIDMQQVASELTRTVEHAQAQASTMRDSLHGLLDTLVERFESHAKQQQQALQKHVEALEQAAAQATSQVDAAQQRMEQTQAQLTAILEQLDAIDSRGREIAQAANEALTTFDEELTSRMTTMRQMMEHLVSVTEHPPSEKPAG